MKNKITFLLILLSSCATTTTVVPDKRIGTTIATIVEPDINQMNGGSYDLLEFFVNGKRYETKQLRMPFAVKNEKFLIKYDSYNPMDNSVILRSPVFLKDEQTILTIGTILHCLKRDYSIDFTYYIGEKKYKKCQVIEKEVRYIPGLKKGAKYEVEYWMENPQRSIIHLNKPITDSILNQRSLYGKFFYRDEKTAFTIGVIGNAHKDYMFLTYTYTISDKEYQEFQDLKTSIGSYSQLINGAKFEVEYSIENPEKSIIYIDKPIKDSLINTK